MHALAAFAVGPVGRYVVLGGLLLAMIGGVWWKVDGQGFDRAMGKVQSAFSRSLGLADAAQDTVQSCPLGKWNREAGRCER
jgi:hypothetical protein